MDNIRVSRQYQQLISLKNFSHGHLSAPQSTSHLRIHHALAKDFDSNLNLLQTAQFTIPRNDQIPRSIPLEEFPPYDEWRHHPDLLAGCQPTTSTPLRIAVLLSGGVDSSLALHLLRAAGHHVVAFYLQIWFQEDFRNFWDACPWEEDLEYCHKVCNGLDVPLHVVPLSNQYWERVVTHCINEVKKGRTPNPDVLCNSRVKFGAFLEYIDKATEFGTFDRIASGHYARRVERGNEAMLAVTPDEIKDQTYFLAHLTQSQLARVLFPLGNLTKQQVRALAMAAALPNMARKDSQGICFLGKVKFSEFIKEHLGEWPGPIIEEESGDIIGYHKGFWFHTVGQRKGIHLSGGPWYVTRKVPDDNAVYVSREYYASEAAVERRNSFHCEDFSWVSSARPEKEKPVYCKVRHGPHMYECSLEFVGSERALVHIDGVDQGLAAGQYAVFYQDGICLGCAVIAE